MAKTKNQSMCKIHTKELEELTNLYVGLDTKIDNLIRTSNTLNQQTTDLICAFNEYKNEKLALKNGQTLELTRDEAIAHIWNNLKELSSSLEGVKNINSSFQLMTAFLKSNKSLLLVLTIIISLVVINVITLADNPIVKSLINYIF